MSSDKWESDCGRVVLYRGDCVEVMKGFADESFDVIWTDPPYGHKNLDGDLHSVLCPHNNKPILNDDGDSMRAVVDGMLREGTRILKSD